MTDNKLTIKDYMSAPQVQQKMSEMFTDKRLLDGFMQSVIAIAGSDDLLAVAEPRSVFNACLTAASLSLPINKNLGFAHIIGYKNNKKGIVEAQFQLGARGFRELAQRSGQYSIINQGDVREGELKGRNRLTGEMVFTWCDDDAEREQLPVIGYFSYFKLGNGFASTLYMSKDQIIAHGQRYSQSFKRGYGPWVDNFDAMALKTVSKLNVSKNGPLSVDMQKAVIVDQAVIHDDNKLDYADGTDSNLEDAKATAIELDAIAEANTVEGDIVDPEMPPIEVTAEPKKPVPPKKSVKEQAAERGWTKDNKQAKLVDDEVINNDRDT